MTTVYDLLNLATECEGRLGEALGSIRDATPDGGVRLLTYNLRRRCSRLRLAVDGLSPEGLDAARRVAFSGNGHFDPAVCASIHDAEPAEVTSAGLLRAVHDHSLSMAALYRDLLNHDLSDDLADLLRTLVAREEKDAGMLDKMIATKYPAPQE